MLLSDYDYYFFYATKHVTKWSQNYRDNGGILGAPPAAEIAEPGPSKTCGNKSNMSLVAVVMLEIVKKKIADAPVSVGTVAALPFEQVRLRKESVQKESLNW